ncbi:transcriptional regulator, TetR family [Clostridium pasteurianum DSM 525 = ATCC 6013]|uniref:Transcriptional regulator, TetR family n=1 Tax=Clostridium pasteurianum DSM 525 = ATCC 6013 TaxID=1262449 RepID=A0A0H3J038_CLOPA|nr:TetR/AcrR family transcriptional regulator [Clostridium pasteurianum]AJA47181.1 transcriptional regulator, TetR family [Clostridium pasteurianum DSM 525 = ATCC 6013]AJA51169.1 transcriptional regulator, TetR family [Clostridium pasteurianum DSM 525 = ATCC 6013]AOZ74536.1 transcriptional regulator [Clostridium pasteurianum DSM 525 = ATCC 6013]AOZ78333.1 transcriptional regulator [Clostridium pasteurianum]ELP59434.1 HTH-type transcriptional regulator YcnC [Clostridium pasteurianum DSM 525 = A
MDKRIKILLIAKERFSQYGYNNVSMQSIAEAGNISKASIYKLFVSKNELLRELIKYNLHKMIYQASSIDLKNNISDEEKFRAKILYEIESYKENKELSKMLMFTSTSNECKDIKEHIEFVRFKLINLNKNILLQYYGEDIENIVLDLTFMLLGIIGSFTQLIIDGTAIITSIEIVDEVKKILDIIINDKKNRPALLNKENMNIKFNYSESENISREGLIEKCLSDMESILKNISRNDNQKSELLSAFYHLNEEILKETKANYLIDALLGYLNQLDSLKPIVIKLRTLL